MARKVQVIGTRADGSPVEYVTIDSDPERPRSMEEFTGQMAARLGLAARSPGGRLVIRLLEGDEEAVKAARDLTPDARYGVLLTLTAFRQRAIEGYPPAVETLTRMRRAWVAKWGDDPPQAPRRSGGPRAVA